MSTLTTQRVEFEQALLALLAGMTSGAGGGAGGGAGLGTIDPTRLTVINYVKAKLDELVPSGEGISFNLSASPNISNPLDLLIDSHLDEATKDILLSAPISVLTPTDAEITDGEAYTDANTGYVTLPANFLRLSSFKMTDWLKAIDKPITPRDKDFKKQSIICLRGGISKPVAVLTWLNPTTRILQYYSVAELHTIDHLLYIPETLAEVFVAKNTYLMDSLAWMCAGKIMQITGMFDAAKLAQERVMQSYTNL